ncbi:protein kinase [Lithohypha guttulata]|uniref:Protein kinase n=1 Tax=Lithohypha guttulata TaxID=1690604 RepID=A0AAN7YCS8_9EURO|nr:protein kinase [Lithohypha guttulata]
MALSQEPINFDLIEEQKENVISLKGGRSAASLARILSPRPSGSEATAGDTRTLNNAIRNEYEKELQAIDEADDPLDIFTRYVNWTLQAYPQPTSKDAQLLPLLERATKTFLKSKDYKNDPRLLKLWCHYIHFFDSTPRETFAFLARHNIGEQLALYYEEFAAWLEGAGRWHQADEVYNLGLEREARPAERLARKYTQFQQRYAAQPATEDGSTSPAMPKVRAALAAKIDPFAPAPADEPQQSSRSAVSNTTKSKKPKMAIFSDDSNAEQPLLGTTSTSGWNSIGDLQARKKENTIEAQPWAGQTLKAGKRAGTATKLEVFKDLNNASNLRSSKQPEPIVNPRTGRAERVFVDMDAVYTGNGDEFSFEELRALHRGWAGMNWRKNIPVLRENANVRTTAEKYKSKEPEDLENLTACFDQKLDIVESTQSQDLVEQPKLPKQKKLKVREVKQETQTVRLRSDSPSKPKPHKRIAAEPTMTMNSRAANNDIYDMYNNASRQPGKDDTRSGAETEFEDDTFSAGESIDTGRVSTTNSEYGDDTISSMRSFGVDDTNASPWSDFTVSKIPKALKKARSTKHKRHHSEDQTEDLPGYHDQSQDGLDTQAIADLANQDFGELDTMAIARMAGNATEVIDLTKDEDKEDELGTPVETPQPDPFEAIKGLDQDQHIPIQPEDYEPTPMRPYRDPSMAAQSKLPFMTPIVEQTESSLAASTIYQSHFATAKTPSRHATKSEAKLESPSKLNVIDLLLESPRPSSAKRRNSEEDANEHSPKKLVAESPLSGNQKILFPVLEERHADSSLRKTAEDIFAAPTSPVKALVKPAAVIKKIIHKGPIINDAVCNPCDDTVIDQILKTVHPAPSSYPGFFDHTPENSNQFGQIRSYTRKLAKQTSKSSPRKALSESVRGMAPVLKFKGTSRVYAIKRELGEGAFAPVYLVDSVEQEGDENTTSTGGRGPVEALKAENEPKTLTWEFHILHLLKFRLGHSSRAMESIILAHECHLYRDECYLVLEYHSQGTLLDLVNQCRADSARAGKTAEGLEEPVAMWLSVELLRTIEDIHRVGILHGDLKADNCLVRLDAETDLSGPYNRRGRDGWNKRGLTLIDLGRGIDTRAFKHETRFIADWKAQDTDCPEIREAKPWKWEIDLFGAAGVIHSLLFGKYIETVSVSGGGLGQKKEWKLRENFKRYWEKDIWTEVFSVLINGGGKKEDEVRKDLQRLRGMMEEWLETESERNGRDLRAGIRRCERLVGAGTGSKGRR